MRVDCRRKGGRYDHSLLAGASCSVAVALVLHLAAGLAGWEWRVKQSIKAGRSWGDEREAAAAANAPQCLVHSVQNLSTPGQALHQQAPTVCGRLTRDWTYNPPLSELAQQFQDHQNNCSLPEAQHYIEPHRGIGSNLNLWAFGLCQAMEIGH